MAVRDNIGEVAASGTVPAVNGRALDPATVAAMLDEHARLGTLLAEAIAAAPVSDDDYWIGMSVDGIAVCGESPGAVVAIIDGRGMAGETVVLEFVSAEPQVIVL